MEYWSGVVTWPVKRGWHCELCGTVNAPLIWGLVTGHCRCDICGMQYTLRSADGGATDTPISRLKEEFIEPAKVALKEYGTLKGITAENWIHCFELCGLPIPDALRREVQVE